MYKYYKKYKIRWMPSKYKSNFNPKLFKIIKYNNNKAGYFSIRYEPNHIHISDIQVLKKYCGKGIGTKVLKYIDKKSISKKYKYIKLRVFSDNPAINLYKKERYKIIKKENNIYFMKRKS